MALVALDVCPVVDAAGKGLSLGVLQFDQAGAGDGMIEVVEIELPVVLQELLAFLSGKWLVRWSS